jgi:RimJ/RimL family protein N-acetyltransferase
MDDLESYVSYSVAQSTESGRDGDVYFGPYSRDEPFPADVMRRRTRKRWATSLNAPGWRRAWGIFDGEQLVGSADVAGSELFTGLHRVMLGIAILRTHRGQGLGRRLLGEVIVWCGAQPSIDWLDLGVFADNLPAQALFRSVGFQEIGRTDDCWRIDGHRVDEISMTLWVGAG